MATLTTMAICLAATSFNPQHNVVRDLVDLIEVNHFYDDKGQLFLEQLIFYEWCPKKSHYDIIAYRLLKTPVQLPRKDYDGHGFVTIWRDGPVLRKVHAKIVRESWTQYDPEIAERIYLAKEKRKNLQHVVQHCPRSDRYPNGVPRPDRTAEAPVTNVTRR